MAIDLDTLRTLDEAGISFAAHVKAPSGGHNVYLDLSDVAKFVEDQDGFAARYYKLTRDEYVEWIATEGTVQCSAKTKSGSRCKNIVSGGVHDDPQEWKAHRTEYCAVHGGPSADK